ncbi:MAG: AAA family ATPase [Acidimicrobiales bacterium]
MGEHSPLPEGPVTIMFTDIEGSTALRTTLGDTKADALFRQHDELVREQIAAHQGQDQKAALGDGFLAMFVSTRRALACAIGIQRALDSFNRGRPGAPLNVRIGLNTGEVAWHDGQLSGEAVHAAARVCAAATGRQILVSDVTRQLAGTLPDVTFRDVGEFQLKGFPQPWRLWDVVWVRETSSLPEQVFVGRENELGMLRAKLNAALGGHGGLVLVGGEPGVGKTTLVKQLIVEAEQRGAFAVFGRCYESEGTVPFSPFVEMLEQALSIMPADLVREDLGDDAPEVARLVPELRRRFPDIGEPLELPPEQQRRFMFNAVASFVTRGASRFPLMLVMDDVHWADEPTLLLIEHMATLMPNMRVLGVGTYRDVELEVSRPLASSMERMLRARLVERIGLKRFDEKTVGTMLEALAAQPAPKAVVDAVFSETEGNPFFVEEVFRHLVEEGKLLEDGIFRPGITIDELDVPESVRLVVGRRLERLGEEAQRVLAAGAVVGRAFPFPLLEEIVEIEPGRLLDIVEEAEAARVIVPEQRGGQVYYSFAHELIRQTLLSSVSMLRRQRLHLTVADAIERTDRRARQERPSEIANHLLQAGAAAEPERTLEYLELSAQRALGSAAFEDALRACEDAMTVVDPDDELRRAKINERRGWALRALGRFDDCIALWDEVIRKYADEGLPDEAAALCYECGYQLVWLSRFDQVFAYYGRGLSILGDRLSVWRPVLMASHAAVLGLAGLYDAAERGLEEADSAARELGDDRALGIVEWGRTVANWSATRFRGTVAAGTRSIELLRRANDQWTLVDALSWTALALAYSGDLDAGLVLGHEAAQLARRLGHHAGETLALRATSSVASMRGSNLGELEQLAAQDLERCDAIKSPWMSQSHAWLAALQILRGDLERARASADRAVELEPVSAFSGIGWSYQFLCRAYGGDAGACATMLAEARKKIDAAAATTAIGPTLQMLAAAHGSVVAGLSSEAAGLYPLVAELGEEMPVALFDLTLVHRVAGMAAAAGERWDDATFHFDIALHQAREFPVVVEEPQVKHWFAKMLLDRGRPEDSGRAREMIEDALAGYRALGMPLHLALAEQLLG